MLKSIKKNNLIVIVSGVFLLFEYILCSNVYMMGDDYMYGTFAKEGIFKSVFDYYFTGNGRWFINILDSLMLSAGRYIFIAVTPILLFLFAWLIYTAASQIIGKKDNTILFVSLLSVAAINIHISRETVYWITGMMNYLLPAVFFLLAVNASLYIVKNNNCAIYKKILCTLVCVLSAATMEQFALMTVGWLFLVFGYRTVKEKKLNITEMLIFVFSVAALASIILAPGNFNRVSEAQENSQTLVEKVIELFINNFQSTVACKYIVPLALIEAFVLFENNKKALGIVSAINSLAILVVDIFTIEVHIAVFAILVMIFAVTSFFAVCTVKSQVNVFYIIVFALLALGSQVMLVVSEIWGYRTSFSVITVYMVILVTLCFFLEKDKWLFPMVCIFAFFANMYLGIACLLVFLILHFAKLKKITEFVKVAAVITVISVSLLKISNGYASNIEIHKANDETAKSVTSDTEVIELKPFNNELYGWSSPPLLKFHEDFLKQYYGIADDVKVVYAEENTGGK